MLQLQKLNNDEILRYLGYHEAKADEQTISIIQECEQLLFDNVQPRYLYQAFPITFQSDTIQIDSTTLNLSGNAIRKHLQECEKAILLCVTISASVDKVIRQMQITDMAKAVILDCCATVAIEQLCDQLELEFQHEFEGYYFTKRFSPGYGDLPISIQKELLTILQAPNKIGLTATSNSILTPKKSVTAIIGLSKNPIEQVRVSCLACNLQHTCKFRKRGERCDI